MTKLPTEWLGNHGWISGRTGYFAVHHCPFQFRSPPCLISSGYSVYQCVSLKGQISRDMKLVTHLHSCVYLHGMLNTRQLSLQPTLNPLVLQLSMGCTVQKAGDFNGRPLLCMFLASNFWQSSVFSTSHCTLTEVIFWYQRIKVSFIVIKVCLWTGTSICSKFCVVSISWTASVV